MINNENRTSISWSDLRRFFEDLDDSFDSFEPNSGEKLQLLSMGSEALTAIAYTQNEEFAVNTKDIDFYTEMDPNQNISGIDNIENSNGSVLKLELSSITHDNGDPFIAELARETANFGKVFENGPEAEKFDREVHDGELIYNGENIRVRAPSTDLYAGKTIKRGAADIGPGFRYKRSKQIEALNDIADTDYDKWQVFPHKDTVSGSWWGKFDGQEKGFEERYQNSLDETTDGRYFIEEREDDEFYTIVDNEENVVATIAVKENSDDMAGFNIQAGKRNSAERDVRYRELAVIERAMMETIESYGCESPKTGMNYEIDDSHQHDGKAGLPGGVSFGF